VRVSETAKNTLNMGIFNAVAWNEKQQQICKT
jgi:hypothetical protein